MKLFSAAIILSSIAAKAIAETDVIIEPADPVEEAQILESEKSIDEVEIKRNKEIGFMTVSTNCTDARFWTKNVIEEEKRKLYGSQVDANIHGNGLKGNNCVRTEAGGYEAYTCHPDPNVGNHFTLPDVCEDSEIHFRWFTDEEVYEGMGPVEDKCKLTIRISCPPEDDGDMPSYYFDDSTSLTPVTLHQINDPCNRGCTDRRTRNLRNGKDGGRKLGACP